MQRSIGLLKCHLVVSLLQWYLDSIVSALSAFPPRNSNLFFSEGGLQGQTGPLLLEVTGLNAVVPEGLETGLLLGLLDPTPGYLLQMGLLKEFGRRPRASEHLHK